MYVRTSVLNLIDALCHNNGDVPLCGLKMSLQVCTKCVQLALQQLEEEGRGVREGVCEEGSVRRGEECEGRRV